MTSACGSLSGNVQSMHGSLVRINTDYLVQIADILNQMQLESVEDQNTTPAVAAKEKDEIKDSEQESQAGKIINQLREIVKQQEKDQDNLAAI